MDVQVLRPANPSLEIKGKLSYHEGSQAWATIRFKRSMLQEFPQLREKIANFSYKMVLFRSYKMLEKELKEMKDKDEPLPLLLFFYKEPDKEQS